MLAQNSPEISAAASRLATICDEIGVRMVPSYVSLAPGLTKCGRILERLLRKYGEGHVILLLRTVMESENKNKNALVNPVLMALSDVMQANPRWPDRGLEWLEAFDTIDLCDLWAEAKLAHGAPPVRYGLASLLTNILYERFPPVVDRPKPKPEKKLPKPKPPPSGIKAIEIGLALNARKGPYTISPIARDVCAQFRIDPNGAGKFIRAARRYDRRPDIYAKVTKAVLFQLSRPSLPDAARQAFEKRILAGERIAHTEIDARCPKRAPRVPR